MDEKDKLIQELNEEIRRLSIELASMKAAMREERGKRKARNERVSLLEAILTEMARSVRRGRAKDQWATVTPRLRFSIFLRDNFTCTYCGATRAKGAVLTIDHVEPASQGGQTSLSNLRTACLQCNQGKSDTRLTLERMVRPSRTPSAAAGWQRLADSSPADRPVTSAIGSHPVEGKEN